jgi:outer membrane protein assembly factor BamE (lipoprotein component of BamABCDE complex)
MTRAQRACDFPSAAASAAVVAALAALAACTTYPFAPDAITTGEARADVLRVMGPPTATYAMPGGHERLEYNRMPFGRKTYMIDLDASGRVARWEQVLDEQHFQQVVPGMHRADVLRLIGPPTYTGQYHLPRPGITWLYRYEAIPKCQLFEVAFDAAAGTVISGDYPPDPACPGEWS